MHKTGLGHNIIYKQKFFMESRKEKELKLLVKMVDCLLISMVVCPALTISLCLCYVIAINKSKYCEVIDQFQFLSFSQKLHSRMYVCQVLHALKESYFLMR